MMVKIELDPETYGRLVQQAVAERRPIIWQAEVALRRAVGLPFPYEHEPAHGDDPAPVDRRADRAVTA